MQERREFARKDTGGHLEIVSVQGSGSVPDDHRATVLNCSRGGILFKVKSPRKRLLRTQEPVLARRDTVTAVLRLPPEYGDIDVLGEVVRVDRAADDPEYLTIGLRFFWDAQRQSGLDDHFTALGRLLEPGRSARLAKASSARIEKPASARLKRASSARLEAPRPSARHKLVAPPPPGEDSSAVLAKMGARTLDESSVAAEAKPAPVSSRLQAAAEAKPAPSSSRVQTAAAETATDLTAWARARLEPSAREAAPRPAAAPPVYTSLVGPELGLYARGSARLENGAVMLELPEHFARQAAPDSLTVHLTPAEECRGLFVQRSGARLLVRELGGGKSAAAFDWLVLAQRRG